MHRPNAREPPARKRNASIYQKRRWSNYASASWWGAVVLFAVVSVIYSTVFAIRHPSRQHLHISAREGVLTPCFVSDTFHLRGGSSGISCLGRSFSLYCLQNEIRTMNQGRNSGNNAPMEKEREFFISDAQVVRK
jgi:hypothetical protein